MARLKQLRNQLLCSIYALTIKVEVMSIIIIKLYRLIIVVKIRNVLIICAAIFLVQMHAGQFKWPSNSASSNCSEFL